LWRDRLRSFEKTVITSVAAWRLTRDLRRMKERRAAEIRNSPGLIEPLTRVSDYDTFRPHAAQILTNPRSLTLGCPHSTGLRFIVGGGRAGSRLVE